MFMCFDAISYHSCEKLFLIYYCPSGSQNVRIVLILSSSPDLVVIFTCLFCVTVSFGLLVCVC